MPELQVPPDSRRGALLLRPWLAIDMAPLVAEMHNEYPSGGLWSRDDLPGSTRWTGPRDEDEASIWLSGQERGWADGDWLAFAVLEAGTDDDYQLAGHVHLKNRDDAGTVGHKETAEIGYWTAVRAVTAWAFDTFRYTGMREIMLVHNVDNLASCQVAEKAGYPYRRFSPAQPPLWYVDGHIHMSSLGSAGIPPVDGDEP